MTMEISLDLINQLKVSLRKEAKLSSYDPFGDNHSESSSPNLPTVAEAIAELDPSPPYLRCRNCKGKLLRGIDSLICVFCGKQQRTSENPPDPIKFTSTSAYKWFLTSLNLDGSEMVEPVKEPSSRGGKEPVGKGIALSEFLDLEIQWSAIEEESVNSENKNPLNLGGLNLDDFFVEGRGDFSKVDLAESSKPVEDDFSDPRSLSLFDSVKSQGVVESQQNENIGLFQGKDEDAQKNVSSEESENLSLFSGRDVKDSVSLAEQGNFGFFEGKDAQNSLKEDENLSLFGGKDAQRTTSSKTDESFGFFEGKDAQRNSSSKNDESFGFFEGKDAQRNSSSKEDKNLNLFESKDVKEDSISSAEQENFGFFEGKDAQHALKGDENLNLFDERTSSSKNDESFGFFEGINTQQNTSSKEDENFGMFKSSDAQRNSSSKKDANLGLFDGAPSSNDGLQSLDDQVVASSSDWDSSDFQSADHNPSQEKISGDPFVSSPVDLSAHMDSVFGSGNDLLYEKAADSSSAYVSKSGDWFQDDLFGTVTGKTQNNDPAVHEKNEGQVVGGNGSSSMDIDWIGDDLWQTSEKKPIEKTLTDDNDDDNEDDWNDFASSANSKVPNNPLSPTIHSGLPHIKNDVNEGSENERQNIGTSVVSDMAKSQEDDKNEGQVGSNGSSSMDINWIGDDLWQTSEKKPIEKTLTDDNDDDDDEDDWNDFASSANSKVPNNLLSPTIHSGLPHIKNDVNEGSENERQNTGTSVVSDIAKSQEDDLFGSFTGKTQNNDPAVGDKNEGQVVGNGSSSMDIDWLGDDLWQTSGNKTVEKTLTDDNDDDDDEDDWNDFASSANSKVPNNLLSPTIHSTVPHVKNDVNEGQVSGNGSSSMDINWIGDDLWQTSEKKPIEKTLTVANDEDDEDDWNDFTSSANSRVPNNPLSPTIHSALPHVKNDVNEGTKVERHTTGTSVVSDIAKGQEDDLFGTWDSFTSSTVLQTPMQPPTNQMNPSAEKTLTDDNDDDDWNDFTSSANSKANPSAEQNPEMNLFGANNNHRVLDFDFFSESIIGGQQTNSKKAKAMSFGTSTLERKSDSTGKDQTLDLVGTTTIPTKSKSDVSKELMSQMHDLSFMLETELSVPSSISKTK